MLVNGFQFAMTNSYKPLPVPAAGLAISTHASEGAQEKALARTVSRPMETYKCWISQADRATARRVAAQILELVRNTDMQPYYIDFEDSDKLLDGWYHLTGAQNFNFRNDFAGQIPFDLTLRREEARGRNRGISWRPALMTVATSGTTAVGLPNDVVSITPNISRTGAEGAVVVATGLSDLGGLIQVTGATPDFTKRVRVFDRGTGAAASTATTQLNLTNWVEVFSPDHVFVSDVILTNGLIMLSFASGSLPQVYRFQNGAWAVNEQITWQPTGGGTNQTVQSTMVRSLGWERASVEAQLAANGKQSVLKFAIDRGMLHVDVVGKSQTSGGQIVYVSPKNLRLAIGDSGLVDAVKADAAFGSTSNAFFALTSTDATMTWLPVIGLTSQGGLGSLTTTSVLLPAVAQGASQRAMFGAAYQSGGPVFLQKEAESSTLVGAGATSQADANASGGNAVRCVGTETTEGISFVPGTDGLGVPTGMTYGLAARVRVAASDAQVCRIVPNSGPATMTLVTSSTYQGQRPVSAAPIAAATGQTVQVLRARYRDIILNDNPAHYYRLNDTNTTLLDSATGGANGTYTATYTQSQTGALTAGGDTDNAVIFNGSTGFATMGDPPVAAGNGAFSFEFWFKRATPGSDEYLVSVSRGGGTRSLAAAYLATTGKVNFFNGTDTQTASSATYGDGAYHHVVVTYDPTTSTLKLYTDTALASSVLAGVMALTGTFGRIGCFNNGSINTQFTAATIDEVATYNYVLTANQVLSHYNAGKALGQLWIDEVGIIPFANAGNGPQELFQQWSAEKKIFYPTFPNG